MNILSIQSHVAYGHVGNAAAVFPLQRLGHEVWPVHTVQFSNHPGYGGFRGETFSANAVREVILGLADRGVPARCDGVLSGYLGDASIGEAVLEAVALIKAANPGARYCCDPVIGDAGSGVYVRAGVPEFFRCEAVAAADVLTPNHFELEWLVSREVRTLAGAAAALDTLHAGGPSTVMVTSFRGEDTPPGSLDCLASGAGGRWRVRTPRINASFNGTGDAIAALFFAHLLETHDAAEALSRASSSVHGLVKRTAEAGSRELLLVAAQDELVAPSIRFEAERI